MSKFTGSTNKKARRYGFSLLETGKEFSKGKKRTSPPGQHNAKKQKLTGYNQQLQEKQKARFRYGLTEKQFRNTFKKVKKKKGILGENLLFTLETRLDNVIYRMGIASTRAAARQVVNHKHILVNGKKLDIPSYQVPVGVKITLSPKLQNNVKIQESFKLQKTTLPFVSFDRKTFEGKLIRLPKVSELPNDIKFVFIVEWYNRLI